MAKTEFAIAAATPMIVSSIPLMPGAVVRASQAYNGVLVFNVASEWVASVRACIGTQGLRCNALFDVCTGASGCTLLRNRVPPRASFQRCPATGIADDGCNSGGVRDLVMTD